MGIVLVINSTLGTLEALKWSHGANILSGIW